MRTRFRRELVRGLGENLCSTNIKLKPKTTFLPSENTYVITQIKLKSATNPSHSAVVVHM